jgi:hypothetical protein
MFLDEARFEKIEGSLTKEGVSRETIAMIIGTIQNMRRESNDLRRRLTWLEDQIDEKDLEEIYVEYQKQFNIVNWSGGPT